MDNIKKPDDFSERAETTAEPDAMPSENTFAEAAEGSAYPENINADAMTAAFDINSEESESLVSPNLAERMLWYLESLFTDGLLTGEELDRKKASILEQIAQTDEKSVIDAETPSDDADLTAGTEACPDSIESTADANDVLPDSAELTTDAEVPLDDTEPTIDGAAEIVLQCLDELFAAGKLTPEELTRRKTDVLAVAVPKIENDVDTNETSPQWVKPAWLTKENIKKFFSYFFPVAIFLSAFAITMYYVTVAAKGEFHSDCTDTIYWAYASYDSGTMLNEDFCYACLLPFSTGLFMIPLISIYGLSMTAHVTGMVIFLDLFVLFLFLMLREMGWKLRSSCLAVSLVLGLTLSSEKMREIFWGHTIYYSLGILFLFIGTFLYFHFNKVLEDRHLLKVGGQSTRRKTIHLTVTTVFLLLFLMLTSTDGISSMSIFTLPFLAAIFAEQITDSHRRLFSKQSLFVYAQLVVIAVMIVCGVKLQGIWAGDIVAGYESAYSSYSAQSEWITNLQGLPLAWLTLFGVEDLVNENLMSLESVENLLHIFSAILIAVFPVIATCLYAKYPQNQKGKYIRIWIWIHWAVTAIILLGYIFGKLSSANWRLTPIIGTSAVLMILVLHETLAVRKPAVRITAILAIPLAAMCAWNFVNIAKMPANSYQDNELYELAEYLEDEGLTYGYATFWRANSITIISNSEVETRAVTVDENGVSPYYYQTLKSWYDIQAEQEDYFLLLDQGEYDTLAASISTLTDIAAETKTMTVNSGATFYILVYPANIF